MKTNKYLKRIGITLMFLLIGTSYMFSQNQSNEDWQLLNSIQSFEVYVQLAECNGEPVYLFKVVNNSEENKTIELIIDVTTEPAFGAVSFEQKMLANSNSGESCASSTLTLPRMMPADTRSLEKIDIQLTVK